MPYPLYAGPGGGEALSFRLSRVHERYWLYITLFLATVCSTTAVGAALQFDFDRGVAFDLVHSVDFFPLFWHRPAMFLKGIPFSFTLLLILLAHEFGHYLAAMFHQVDASLPYFLPSPFLGTFGAFIRVRSAILSKRVLFDIGYHWHWVRLRGLCFCCRRWRSGSRFPRSYRELPGTMR